MNGTINPGRTPGFYSFHLIFDYIFYRNWVPPISNHSSILQVKLLYIFHEYSKM